MNPLTRTPKTLAGLFAAAVLGLGLTANTPAQASIITYSVTATANSTLLGLSGTALTGEFSYNTTAQAWSNDNLSFEGLTQWTYAGGTSLTTGGIAFTSSTVPPCLFCSGYTLSISNIPLDAGANVDPMTMCSNANTQPGQCFTYFTNTTISVVAAPEPEAWLMMLVGLVLLAPLYRRHRKRQRS